MATLNLTTNNAGPTVSWSAPANNSSVAGKISIKATTKPASNGTAVIKKVCLTINGENTSFDDFEATNASDGYVSSSSLSNGCWTVSSYYDTRNLTFNFDTTKWENKSYAFAVKVVDTSDRESAVATLNLTTNNPGPVISNLAYQTTLPLTSDVSIKSIIKGFEVNQWCIESTSKLGSIKYEAVFFNANNQNVDEWYIKTVENCWTSNTDISNIIIKFGSTDATNGSYLMNLFAIDENNHRSDTAAISINVNDPGLTFQITQSGDIQAPSDEIRISNTSTGSARVIESIEWTVNGRFIDGESRETLTADPRIIGPGKNQITAKITDNLGNSTNLTATYNVKWTPTVNVYGINEYYFYSPATPKATIKLYIGNVLLPGKLKLTATYLNSSGKKVSQKFDITNGSGTLVLQSLTKVTDVSVLVPATSSTQATSAAFTVDVRKRPPAPIITKVSITAPTVTVWPKSFTANVSLTGKGNYACSIRFQGFSTNFTMSAGTTKKVLIQPTYLSNSAEFLSGSCIGPAGAGTSFFDTWVIVSIQK